MSREGWIGVGVLVGVFALLTWYLASGGRNFTIGQSYAVTKTAPVCPDLKDLVAADTFESHDQRAQFFAEMEHNCKLMGTDCRVIILNNRDNPLLRVRVINPPNTYVNGWEGWTDAENLATQ